MSTSFYQNFFLFFPGCQSEIGYLVAGDDPIQSNDIEVFDAKDFNECALRCGELEDCAHWSYDSK